MEKDKHLMGIEETGIKPNAGCFGRLNNPTSSSYVRGPCGDDMEFYLVIKGAKIEEVSFYTQGCDSTKACGQAVAEMAYKRTVSQALTISAAQVLEKVKDLPPEYRHCSILALAAFYFAVSNYLLTK